MSSPPKKSLCHVGLMIAHARLNSQITTKKYNDSVNLLLSRKGSKNMLTLLYDKYLRLSEIQNPFIPLT